MGFRVTLTGRPIFANRPMGACGCAHPGLCIGSRRRDAATEGAPR